jgi:thiol-disulfide isomerase/thioredoxin
MIKQILLCFALALVCVGCGPKTATTQTKIESVPVADVTVEEVTELETVLAKGKVVVVDFGAPWCGPCRNLEPQYKQWAQRNTNAIFVKVNIDNAPQLRKDYKIEFIPHLIVMKGDKMIRLEQNTEAKVVEAIKALEK